MLSKLTNECVCVYVCVRRTSYHHQPYLCASRVEETFVNFNDLWDSLVTCAPQSDTKLEVQITFQMCACVAACYHVCNGTTTCVCIRAQGCVGERVHMWD